MDRFLLKITLIGLFSTMILAADGFSGQLLADSRIAFGGRAAEMAENTPPHIVAETEDNGLFLLTPQNMPAPAAGEKADNRSLSEPYYDYDWENADEFYTSASGEIADPLEPWNRFWHGFNDILWRQYGQAIWQTYELITPQAFRQGVSNFFNNIAFPVRFINCLLQGKPMEAGVELQRFIMNSTLGLGGLMNPGANSKPLWCDEPDVTGFGQTLGRWGVGDGFYIVWPVIGPSTARESIGLVGDFAANPMTYASIHWENWATNTAIVLRANHAIGENIDNYNSLLKISVEPYSALRNAYVQGSRSRVLGLEAPDQ